MYFEVFGKPCNLKRVNSEKQRITDIRKRIEKAFMQYCYRLLDVDFPERGFLLFWQLPLSDKLRYFEIEEDIAKLKKIDDHGARKNQLDDLLEFLGADPIEKVDEAFKERYGAGIVQYLELH
jgi:phosphoglucomutase/phosphomannomutase